MVGKFFYPARGGMEQHMLDHFRALKDDIDFTLLVLNKENKLVEEDFEGARLIRVPVSIGFGNIPLGFKLWKYMSEYNGDIILIHAPNPIPTFRLLAPGIKARVIVMHHYDITKQKLLNFFYRPFLLAALKNADSIVATAENNIRYSNVLKNYRSKCKVIPLGINPDNFIVPDDTLKQSEALKKKYPGKKVLFVGRFTYYKGIEYLIEASKKCCYHLFIVGQGSNETQLRSLARDNPNIHFFTAVDDLLPFYNAADLFVLPSVARSEAFGIVQLEAMVCGLPVITTNLPSGVPEVQADGETGFIVEPKDTGALRKKIDYLLGNDEVRKKMAEAAKRRVYEKYTLAATKQQYLNLYYE